MTCLNGLSILKQIKNNLGLTRTIKLKNFPPCGTGSHGFCKELCRQTGTLPVYTANPASASLQRDRRATAINKHSALWQLSGTRTVPIAIGTGAKTRAPAKRVRQCFAHYGLRNKGSKDRDTARRPSIVQQRFLNFIAEPLGFMKHQVSKQSNRHWWHSLNNIKIINNEKNNFINSNCDNLD